MISQPASHPTQNTNLRPEVLALHNVHILLHIYRYVSLVDCFHLSLVCRTWNQVVKSHFKTITKLVIAHNKSSHEIAHQNSLRLSSNSHYTLEQYKNSTVAFVKFARLLSLFPSVRDLSFKNHPFNEVYLSIVIMLMPNLQQLHLISCWYLSHDPSHKPSNLVARICSNRSNRIKTLTEYLMDIFGSSLSNGRVKHLMQAKLSQIAMITSEMEEKPRGGSHEHDHRWWSALSVRYVAKALPCLTHLSLTNCHLNDQSVVILLQSLRSLKQLNISDNDQIDGSCFRYLTPTCEELSVGSFSVHGNINELIIAVSQSPATSLKQLELTGSLIGSLTHLERLVNLESLVMHFFVSEGEVARASASLHSVAALGQLRTLVLQQEYCHEEESVVNHELLCAITRHCRQLERLEILGEFGWYLRLTDQSLGQLVSAGLPLRHLSLTGEARQISDRGIRSLAKLDTLESLSLTCFGNITDQAVTLLIEHLTQLRHLILKDNSRLTASIVDACIQAACDRPQRTLNVCLDEKIMSGTNLLLKYVKDCLQYTRHNTLDRWVDWLEEPEDKWKGTSHERHHKWPVNLNVTIDHHQRLYRYDGSELTFSKMISLVAALILIVAMMLVTLAVTIFLPAGIALYHLMVKISLFCLQ